MNNNFKILQKIKIDLFSINSYYSFRNPEKISEVYYVNSNATEYNINDEILDAIFIEVKEGFFNAKLDEVKRIINMPNQSHKFIEKDKFYIESYKNKKNGQIYNEQPNVINERLSYWNNYLKTCLNVSNQFFYLKNGKIYIDANSIKYPGELKVGENFNNKFEWSLIKQLIDIDIVIGTYLVEKGIEEDIALEMWQSPIFTTETVLEKKLEKGLAETHMHIGATKRFCSIWTSLMNNKEKNKDEIKLNTIKIDTISGKISISKELYSARIIRLLMAYYLRQKDNYGESFNKFIELLLNENTESDTVRKKSLNLSLKKTILLRELINNFKTQKGKLSENKIKGLFNDIRDELELIYYDVSGFDLDMIDVEEEDKEIFYKGYLNNSILSQDILTSVFSEVYKFNKEKNYIYHNFKSVVMPESILIYRSLDYLKSHEDDLFFSECFWQYIKLKNIVYKSVNQSLVEGKGLETFSRHYHIQSKIDISGYLAEAFYSQIKDQNIKKMEFRMGPNSELSQLKKNLIEIFQIYKMLLDNKFIVNKIYKQVTLIGIVYHFIKRSDDNSGDKCTLLNKNMSGDNITGSRHCNNIENYNTQASNIARLRREIPELQNYIVGIDAASKELDIDPYYFKSAYELLRNDKNENITIEKDIGFTYHVGEDFRDIISGLRAVDEVIEVLNFKSGDRIGHGIVLGINVDKWVEMNPVIYLKAEEYLDNLLWEWGLYSNSKEFKGVDNINYLEQQIFYTVEYIFGFSEGLRIRDLYNSYIRKINNDPYKINSCNECRLINLTEEKYNIQNNNMFSSDVIWTSNLIYEAYSCKYFIKEFNKTVTVNIDNNMVQKYKILQQHMRNRISNKQIVIELNPSSNLAIGEFNSFEDYHIINLSSPEKEDIIVTLNTDDPVVFNTNLSNEYALMYDIMMKRGAYSSKEIIEWLDRLRKNGLEYSFINDRKMNYEEISDEIKIILHKLYELTD